MDLSNQIANNAQKRNKEQAALEKSKAAEVAATSMDTENTCPECGKEMDLAVAGTKPAFACYSCRICLPRATE